MSTEDIVRMARQAGLRNHIAFFSDSEVAVALARFAALVVAADQDRCCAAIKAEDDYCVDTGDYMLDSDDCIKVVRGTWQRPDFAVG
jgi:hypothetical protein